jgi:hypothetical protein
LERILKPTRTSNIATIAPAGAGWRVRFPSGNGQQESRAVQSLEEAAAALPANVEVHLALPCTAVLFERMKLPSLDAGELGGMVKLQLEKSLPYAPEEVTSGFQIVEKAETDSTVLAVTVNNEQLAELCQPLQKRARLPAKITGFALQAAAACPKDQVVLLIYREGEKLVLAICEKAKLAHVQLAASPHADELLVELPQFVLGADLEGIPTAFASVRLDKTCAELEMDVVKFFNVPVQIVSLDVPLPESDVNLVPAAWREDQQRAVRRVRTKSRLIAAGVIYAVLMAAAYAFLFWMQHKLETLDAKVKRVQPDIEAIRSREQRWLALAPAIDPARSTVEVLFQVYKSLPSDSIRITVFEQTKDQVMIEGEAPTANLAIELGERLKKNPDLKAFKFNVSPPQILPNEHAQFKIFGKP